MRFFSRRHRCITYSARGYKPSDVPKRLEGLQLQALGRATRSPCSTISRSTRRISSACRWAATLRCMLGLHVSRPRAVADRRPARAPAPSAPTSRSSARPSKATADEFEKQGHAAGGESLRHEPGAHSVRWSRTRAASRSSTRCSPSTTRRAAAQHHARLPGRAALALRFRGRYPEDQGADADRGRRRGRSVPGAELLPQAVDHDRRAWWCCPRPATW